MKKVMLLTSRNSNENIWYYIEQEVNKFEYTCIRIDENYNNQYGSDDIIKTFEMVEIIIADVSDDSNDYIIGQASILKKPILFISNSKNNLNIKYSKYLVIIYSDIEPIRRFINQFSQIFAMTIVNLKKVDVNAQNLNAISKKNRIFISYCHIDSDYLQRLLIHLKPLERNGSIDVWVDTRIKSGEKWKEHIQEALENSGVGILLISADFIASDFIINDELPTLLKNAQQNGTRIIPIVLKPCRFTREKSLSAFQSVNDPKRPLNSLSEDERELIYDSVAQRVEDIISN
jgi:hypothetical protein